MKKVFYSLILVLMSCGVTAYVIDQDFISDLASENNRIAGELYITILNKDLTGLNYDYYINYIETHEKPSAKDLAKKIKFANSHFFKSKKNSFLLILLYTKDNIIVCDKSNTTFIDSVINYKSNSKIPNFDELSAKLNY